MTQLRGPEALPAPRGDDPGPRQLGEPRDPLAVVRVDRFRQPGLELRVQRLGPALGEVALDPLPDLRWHRRAQVELGEGRPQVETGAADDDWPPLLVEESVDLGVGQLSVAAGAELLARLDERQ